MLTPQTGIWIDGDDARAGPRIGARTSALANNGTPRPSCADLDLQTIGLWLPNGGALWIRPGGGEFRKAPMGVLPSSTCVDVRHI